MELKMNVCDCACVSVTFYCFVVAMILILEFPVNELLSSFPFLSIGLDEEEEEEVEEEEEEEGNGGAPKATAPEGRGKGAFAG